MQKIQTLTLRQPDDWHIHLRDGAALSETCRSVSRYFRRAIVMPNLKPPVATVAQAEAYRERILAHVPEGNPFTPLMTLYLTESTSLSEIKKAAQHPHIYACKFYPAGATTHSDAGVRNIDAILPVLECMEANGLPLLLHGEVTDESSDIFDREKIFIDTVFQKLQKRFPALKMVFEHITTKDAVDFVKDAKDNIAATITPHHLLYNRNHMLSGGIKPHYYCLPVLKKNTHQQALIKAAISGHSRFFLGTDSAPHAINQKQSACGCAGIYSAPAAMEMYAEVFEQQKALDKLEKFASEFGARFYGLPLNETFITLKKQSWKMPEAFNLASEKVFPMCAGETIHWQLDDAKGQLAE